MTVAFLSEMPFHGKVMPDYPNMRTEFAWMFALNADHYNLRLFSEVKNYDHVFIILPKGDMFVRADGYKIAEGSNSISPLLQSNLVQVLKTNNKKVHYVQEGPHWWYTDYELSDQISFYNTVASCDSIFAHNEYDVAYYKGLFNNKPVHPIGTLMVPELLINDASVKEDKVIIGGNFARWYGGFESYIVAQQFEIPIWTQTSHATRDGEDQIVNQLPRVAWVDWMKQLSSFKYAVHLMPTVAAGTFALNCAYFGIPCIGNGNVDTQRLCHRRLSVDVGDIETARHFAAQLKNNKDFYERCSKEAKEDYAKHYSIEIWKSRINKILNEEC